MTTAKTALLMGSILILLSGVVIAGGPIFYGNMSIGVKAEPDAFAIGDLQGDGGMDMVIVDEYSRLYVAYSRHDGTFTESIELIYNDSISSFWDVKIADVNGDNRGDIIYSWEDDYDGYNHVSVILSEGYPVFADPVHYLANNSANDIEVFDVDGDGDNDIVVTCTYFISVFPNNGDGTFGTRVDHNVGYSWNYEMAVANFDGDTDIDIAVCNYNHDTMWIMINDGSGTFTATTPYATDGYCCDVVAAKLNNDDIYDLAVVELTNNKILVFMGNGDGTFADSVNYHTGYPVRTLNAADMDGDNDVDLIITAWSETEGMFIMDNDGAGIFGSPEIYDIDYCMQVWPYDFDGDTDIDLAARGDDEVIYVLFNNGFGEFPGPGKYTAGSRTIDIYAEDFDGDGDKDIATIGYNSDDVMIFLHNDGDSTFAAGVSYTIGNGPYAMDVADVDQDDDFDIITANEEADSIAILFNNGNGTFNATPAYYHTGDKPRYVIAAGLNNDPYPDLVVGCYAYSNNVWLFINDGDGTFTNTAVISANNRVSGIAAVNLDGDADIDIAVTVDKSPGYIDIHYNDGDGNFTKGDSVRTCNYPEGFIAVDLDKDNDIDFIISGNDNGICVQLNNGDGTYTDTIPYMMEYGPHDFAVGDIDKDNDLDVVASARWSSYVTVFGSDGNGALESQTSYEGGYQYVWPVFLADMNYDTYLDLIVSTTKYTGIDSLMIFWNTKELIPVITDDDGIINNLPQLFSLAQNYPNPFNPTTTISYTLESRSHVKLTVYNLLGQKVVALVDESKPPGNYDVVWNGKDDRGNLVASGIYFYQLETDKQAKAKKMILIK